MKKLAPLLITLLVSFGAVAHLAYAQAVQSGSVQEGGICYASDPENGDTDCAGNLACINGRCAVDNSLDSAGFGQQNGTVGKDGACAYNADCADQGSTQYECINSQCEPDEGTVSSGGSCTVNEDCAGDLACISGICQVDAQLDGQTGAGTTGTGATGATTNTSGAGGINTSYLQGYEQSIVSIVNTILVPLLVAVAFIIFLWGVFNYFIRGAAEPEKRKEGAQFVLWGIIGFAIIFSVWGLVNLLLGTLSLSAGGTHGAYPTL